MKKYLGIIIVFGLFVLCAPLIKVSAFTLNTFPDGCTSNSDYSHTTGLGCASAPNLVSFYPGLINKHVSSSVGGGLSGNVWVSDTAKTGSTSANVADDNFKLNYCKKFYPNTTSVVSFGNQTLVDWKDKLGANYTSTRMAYQCVQAPTPVPASITVTSPNGGEKFNVGDKITVTWTSKGISATEIVNICLDNNFQPGAGNGCSQGLGSSINDGSEVVTLPLPAQALFGLHYKVYIERNGQVSPDPINDLSDNLFTINPPVSDCQTFYWTDNNNQTCASAKSFCGSYMYQGLKTFKTQSECLASIPQPTGSCSPTSAPSITVTSPNGGETFNLSDTFRPSWTWCNIAEPQGMSFPVSIVDLANPSVEYSVGQGESTFGTTINHTSSISQAPSLGQKNFKLKVTDGNHIGFSSDTFTIRKTVSTCKQTASGLEKLSLDNNNPLAQNVSQGATNIELARIKLTNIGDQDICFFDGLQLGSYDNVNNYLTNVRVIDLSNNTQIGPTSNTFSFFGATYYYSWVEGLNLPVPVGTGKTFMMVGDIKTSSSLGQFKFGVFGINHTGKFGASGYISPVIGNTITVSAPTTTGNLVWMKNPGYLNQTVSPNTKQVKIGSFLLRNTTTESIKITDLYVPYLVASSAPLSDLSNLTIYADGNLLSGPVVPVISGNHFAPNLILTPGTKTIDVYADLGTATTGTIQIGFNAQGVGTTTGNYYPTSGILPITGGQILTLSPFRPGCTSNSGFDGVTGTPCASGRNLISYWTGMIDEHVSDTDPGTWTSDPDKKSGTNIPMLTYCKKWWPKTTSVVPFGNQTLVDWKNVSGKNYTSTRMAYKCVQPVMLTFSKAPSSPLASTVTVSSTNITSNIPLLDLNLKATGSDVLVTKLPMVFTEKTSTNGHMADMVSAVRLSHNGMVLDTEEIPVNCNAAPTCGLMFNLNDGLKILNGTTETLTVSVNVNHTSALFANGDSLFAFRPTKELITEGFVAEDNNGDLLKDSNLSGGAQGDTQTFNTGCISVIMGTPTYMSSFRGGSGAGASDITSVTYAIPLSITSCDTQYIGQIAQVVQSVTNTGKSAGFISYGFNNATNPTSLSFTSPAPNVVVGPSNLSSTDALIEGNGFRIDAGTTKHFNLVATLSSDGSTLGGQKSNIRVALQNFQTFNDSGLTFRNFKQPLLPVELYKTGYVGINSN